MRGKILFVAGLGVGYVLGTRAGRERYEQIKSTAAKFWNDPRVQRQVDTVETFVKDKAPDVAEFVSENAKKVVFLHNEIIYPIYFYFRSSILTKKHSFSSFNINSTM